MNKEQTPDEKTIIRLLSQVIINIKTLGLPKHPFLINAPSEDGHSLFLCIWPIATDEYRTKVLRLEKEMG